MNITLRLLAFSGQALSTQVLLGILADYQRPYDKIVDLVKQGYLVQLRKGLYIISSNIDSQQPEPFLIANHLYGPSYISLDSALFYWGLIPERVFEQTSVTTKLSKRFTSQHISYSYTHLPSYYYALGIQSVLLAEKQSAMLASPEKALCDKIVTTAGINLRSHSQTQAFLMEDLRIEKENLQQLNHSEMITWLPNSPKKNSLRMLIETITSL
ncbi:hypothetical protein [Aquirufa sp.]|jgi:hypothetical protein|uniref:hypothetical protein n=1 Tax=Aquirufa sp. TaxID=2676249 RepID=UPI0037BFA5AC